MAHEEISPIYTAFHLCLQPYRHVPTDRDASWYKVYRVKYMRILNCAFNPAFSIALDTLLLKRNQILEYFLFSLDREFSNEHTTFKYEDTLVSIKRLLPYNHTCRHKKLISVYPSSYAELSS